MPIPEAQLAVWSHQGAIAQSSATYNGIKNVLEVANTRYASKNFKVFLQGSYGNDTNIYAESDVDVVIRLDDCYYDDLTSMPEQDREAYQRSFNIASYTLANFKQDVLTALYTNFGAAVDPGNKAITITAGQGRRKADVIVAAQFRRYYRFRSHSDANYAEGICFFDGSGRRVANYPKQHSDNLTSKHQSSGQWLKPLIRVFKNIRAKLVADGVIDSSVAPSYFIEGLLHNVPNGKLGTSLEDSVVNAVNWYLSEANKSELVCANGQYYLLRDGLPTCWAPADCEAFISALASLWKNWR